MYEDSVMGWFFITAIIIIGAIYLVKWAVNEYERDKKEIQSYWDEQGWT